MADNRKTKIKLLTKKSTETQNPLVAVKIDQGEPLFDLNTNKLHIGDAEESSPVEPTRTFMPMKSKSGQYQIHDDDGLKVEATKISAKSAQININTESNSGNTTIGNSDNSAKIEGKITDKSSWSIQESGDSLEIHTAGKSAHAPIHFIASKESESPDRNITFFKTNPNDSTTTYADFGAQDIHTEGSLTSNSIKFNSGEKDEQNKETSPDDYKTELKLVGVKRFAQDGEAYAAVGLNAWDDYTGGKSHELAFTANGLKHRIGDQPNGWYDWKNIVECDTQGALNEAVKKYISNLIYPIGSVIMTVDKDYDPNGKLEGTWSDWTDGYLKVSNTEGETYGNTYGDADYKISVDMLPQHLHNVYFSTYTGYSTSNIAVNVPICNGSGGDASIRLRYYTSDDTDNLKVNVIDNNHKHEVNISGSTEGISNRSKEQLEFKPKYYAVIAWQRVG